MEKTVEQNAYVLKEKESIGTVKIANDVVASIAGIAAMEVDGVAGMAGNIGNELISRIGAKGSKGAKVEMSDGSVKVDVAVIVEYGYSIPAISQKVQDKIKTAINSMTGLEVTDVNVRITGVNMQKN